MNGLRWYQRLPTPRLHIVCAGAAEMPCPSWYITQESILYRKRTNNSFCENYLLQTQVQQNGQAECVHHMKFPNWFTSLK